MTARDTPCVNIVLTVRVLTHSAPSWRAHTRPRKSKHVVVLVQVLVSRVVKRVFIGATLDEESCRSPRNGREGLPGGGGGTDPRGKNSQTVIIYPRFVGFLLLTTTVTTSNLNRFPPLARMAFWVCPEEYVVTPSETPGLMIRWFWGPRFGVEGKGSW